MIITKHLLTLFCGVLISFQACANNPIDGKYSRIVGHHDTGGRVFRIQNIYKGQQIYYISSAVEKMTIRIPQNPSPWGGPERIVIVDAGRMIRQAFIDWTVSGSFGGHFGAGERAFTETTSSPLTAGITFNADNNPHAAALATTDFEPHIQHVTHIYFNTNVIGDIAVERYRYLVNGNIINPSQVNLDDFVRMQVNFAVIHEIGHAFGLDHPNLDDIDEEDNVEEQSINTIILPSGSVYEPPSIMVGPSWLFYRILHDSLGRAIIPADIQVTPRDFRGARMHWRGISSRQTSVVQSLMETCVLTPSCM